MAKNSFVVGIDIGTYQIKVVIAEPGSSSDSPRVIGTGYAESKGLRHGYIVHQVDAVKSLRKAIRKAEKVAGVKVDKAFISVGGIGLSSTTSSASIMVTRADSEVTELDIEKVFKESQDAIPTSVSINNKIIHAIPLQYKLDGKEVLGRPIGMKGSRLETKTLFITCLEHHLNELIQTVEDAGVEIIDVMAAPLAASLVVLNKTQKVAGCVLANIGSETASIVVYEDGIPVSLEVFPIGSNDITNDIALGLQVSLEDAESIKKGAFDEEMRLSKRKLEEIIGARLSDIFELIEAHLKKIGKNGLLPAGIIITGGGSGITTIDDFAKAYLKLPSSVASVVCNDDKKRCLASNAEIKDSSWAVAYGLTLFGLNSEGKGSVTIDIGAKIAKKTKNTLTKWVKQFLP